MRIENSIHIAAPVERVWELTVDVEAWSEHSPTITSVERIDDGPLRVGSTARIKQPAQGMKTWTVTELEPQKRFAWATTMFGTTMTGGHQLSAAGSETTNLLTVDIEGRLAPVLGVILKRPLLKAITTENRGFKAAAEAVRATDGVLDPTGRG